MSLGNRKESVLEKIEGVVEKSPIGRKLVRVGYVKGNRVYRPVYGGKDRLIGYIENGVAYENVYGGKDRPIGNVKYFKNSERR